jgi:hypothetical protein
MKGLSFMLKENSCRECPFRNLLVQPDEDIICHYSAYTQHYREIGNLRQLPDVVHPPENFHEDFYWPIIPAWCALKDVTEPIRFKEESDQLKKRRIKV